MNEEDRDSNDSLTPATRAHAWWILNSFIAEAEHHSDSRSDEDRTLLNEACSAISRHGPSVLEAIEEFNSTTKSDLIFRHLIELLTAVYLVGSRGGMVDLVQRLSQKAQASKGTAAAIKKGETTETVVRKHYLEACRKAPGKAINKPKLLDRINADPLLTASDKNDHPGLPQKPDQKNRYCTFLRFVQKSEWSKCTNLRNVHKP